MSRKNKGYLFYSNLAKNDHPIKYPAFYKYWLVNFLCLLLLTTFATDHLSAKNRTNIPTLSNTKDAINRHQETNDRNLPVDGVTIIENKHPSFFNNGPIDQYFQKIEIYPTSSHLSNDGKITLRLKRGIAAKLLEVVFSYGPDFERKTVKRKIDTELIEIDDLRYNEYEFYLVGKDGQKIVNSTFALPVPSKHQLFKGTTNYLKPYQSHLSSGLMVVHDYVENRATSRNAQNCNYNGYTLQSDFWYKAAQINSTGGGGVFFYLDASCAATSPYELNCTYSPGGPGNLYNTSVPTQWVEADPYVAFGQENTQKLAYIYLFEGGLNDEAEDLSHCLIDGSQCPYLTQEKINQVVESYPQLTIDGSIDITYPTFGQIDITTNADWVYLPSGHNLSICGGQSATIDGNILKIDGSDSRTVRLCTANGILHYDFCIKSVNKTDLLYLTSSNQIRQYFFGAKVNTATDICVTSSCRPNITHRTHLDETCGQSNGQIQLTYEENTNSPIFWFSIDNGQSWQESSDFGSKTYNNLASGTYILKTRWFVGCEVDLGSVVINNQNEITDYGTISGNESKCGSYNPTLVNGTAVNISGSATLPIYQWQQNVNNSGWGNIIGASLQNYAPSTISQTTAYRRKVSSNNGCEGFSNIITKTVQTCIEICNNGIDDNGDGKIDCADFTCPEVCSCDLEVILEPNIYNDAQTPNDVTDDTFTFRVTINGTGIAGWEGGGKVGFYGETVLFGPYPVDSSGAGFKIKDKINEKCFTSISTNMSSCIYLETCTCCASK